MSRRQTGPCACARAGLPINCRSCQFHRDVGRRGAAAEVVPLRPQVQPAPEAREAPPRAVNA